VIYHDHHFQRQRYHERVAEMREEYRRAQPPPRREAHPHVSLNLARQLRSIGERIRRLSARRAPAYRA
jgi:hypothetical protein